MRQNPERALTICTTPFVAVGTSFQSQGAGVVELVVQLGLGCSMPTRTPALSDPILAHCKATSLDIFELAPAPSGSIVSMVTSGSSVLLLASLTTHWVLLL